MSSVSRPLQITGILALVLLAGCSRSEPPATRQVPPPGISGPASASGPAGPKEKPHPPMAVRDASGNFTLKK